MAENSKIEWTDATWNPWRGCTKVSAGCANCYAEALSGRNPKTLGVWGPNGTRVVAAESQWKLPLKWNKDAACSCGDGFRGTHSPYCPQADRPRVFCASLADVFEDWQGPMVNSTGDDLFNDRNGRWSARVGDKDGHRLKLTMGDVRTRLFQIIDATPNLDWLLLTKRPENIARMMPKRVVQDKRPIFPGCPGPLGEPVPCIVEGGTRHNVWLGTSVENQAAADERIPHLLRTPAAVRFLSCEPLLGPVDLGEWMYTIRVEHNGDGDTEEVPCRPDIHWVIVGGESGHGARTCNVEWMRSLVKQCKAASVPVFVKQLGSSVHKRSIHSGNPVEPLYPITLRDRKGGDMDEWPADFRVREYPTAR